MLTLCKLCFDAPAVTGRRYPTSQDPIVPMCRDCAQQHDAETADPDYENESSETKFERSES